MEFKKKFKFSIRKLSIGVVSLSLGLTTLAQPIALLGQSNVAHAEEATPAAEKKAGKVTIERVDLDTKPEIQAGEEFKIKIKWVADPGQTNLGGLNSELNFDINTMEYVKVETVTPDGMGNSFINLAAVKKGKSRFGSTPFTNKELEAIFTFKAKRNITAADNYNFVFKAFPAPDGRVRWYTEPDYSGPTPLISSWEGLGADGTISVKLAKEAEATYNATYEFESVTAGKDLPQEVKDLLPTDNTKYKKDDQVAAKQPTSTEVADAAQDGKWVFKGYEPAGPVTVADKDVKFVGKWEFKANEHNVSYEFTSGTAGKELPQAVKDLLPTDAAKYVKGAQVNAVQPAQEEVEDAAQDGKWVFKGYEPASPVTVGTEDVKFVGKWEFEAKEHNATYKFESGTAGKELPQEVKDLLPTDVAKYKKGEQVNAKQPGQTQVTVADGKWEFKGYEPAGPVTMGDKDVEFVGKWEYKANPVAKYTVGYKFESETAGKELPQEVKDLLPTDANEYENGAQVDAKQPAKAEVEVADGKWVFKGYAANQQTVNGSNVEFVGKWAFEAKQVTKYTVDYAFASSTAGKQLPGEVLALIPTDSKEYTNGEEVIAKDPAKTEVEVADGKWTFDGYQQNKFTVNNANVTFQGTWTFTAKPKPPVTKYKATYEFTSTDTTKALPAEVLALLPTDADEYVNGATVNAKQPAKTEVTVADGKWTFNGYGANQQTVNGSDVKFSGTWTFTANATPPANKYKATYEFKSADATKALPAGVLRLLPNDTKEYANGDKAKAIQPAATSVVTPTGTWTFAGYDANEKPINGAGVKFTGTWTFTASQTPPPAVEKKGSVIVRYVSTDNKKLKDDYIDTKDAVVGTPYNTAENETERPSVIVKDGVKYELVEIKGNPRGKVVEGTTVVTYVYKKVAQQPGGTDKPWDPFKPGEQKPTKPGTGKGKLANTGQTTTNAGIAGVALAGLALAAMRRRKNK